MENNTHTLQEIWNIGYNMRKYGGSFVRCIGEALLYADSENIKKLEKAFPEYFEKYLNYN